MGYAKPNLVFMKQGPKGAGGGDKKRRGKKNKSRSLLPLKTSSNDVAKKSTDITICTKKDKSYFLLMVHFTS